MRYERANGMPIKEKVHNMVHYICFKQMYMYLFKVNAMIIFCFKLGGPRNDIVLRETRLLGCRLHKTHYIYLKRVNVHGVNGHIIVYDWINLCQRR